MNKPARWQLKSLAVWTVLLSACSGEGPEAQSKDAQAGSAIVREQGVIRVPESSPARKALEIATVQEESVERPIIVPGVIEADAAKLIKVVPPVSGRILRLEKRLGDSVKRGEPLFTLESSDLAQAYGDANKAQVALNLAQRNLQRQKELAVAEIASRKDLEQAQSDYDQAATEAERTKARLAQLGLTLGTGTGREYTLRSPIAGRVIELTGAQGAFWNDTNAPIMTVADLSTVWLAASLQEKDLTLVFVGQPAKITLNAYEGESFDGKVSYVSPVLDPDTRTVKVRIAIDNDSGRFRPGMFARVVFSGKPHMAPVVPASALVQSGFNTRIFVEQSPGVFEARVVKIGAQMGDRVEIVSGLKAGERVVVKNGVLLND